MNKDYYGLKKAKPTMWISDASPVYNTIRNRRNRTAKATKTESQISYNALYEKYNQPDAEMKSKAKKWLVDMINKGKE